MELPQGFCAGWRSVVDRYSCVEMNNQHVFFKIFLQQNRMMVQFVEFDFSYQKSLYEICVSTCDDWGDGHDLFPDKQFNMAGDRSVIYSSNVVFLFLCMCGSLDRRYIYSFSPLYS